MQIHTKSQTLYFHYSHIYLLSSTFNIKQLEEQLEQQSSRCGKLSVQSYSAAQSMKYVTLDKSLLI